ncbi:hypothetical protein BaRGS_00021884 [Batillaria attramentaria]|uniref:SEA domain-containing protein n=1 Tax=Batillaria attramentaria TaxID=370345 RepID=A0ABD0KIJ6_9CAEN
MSETSPYQRVEHIMPETSPYVWTICQSHFHMSGAYVRDIPLVSVWSIYQRHLPMCGACQRHPLMCGACQRHPPMCGACQRHLPMCGACQRHPLMCGACQRHPPMCGAYARDISLCVEHISETSDVWSVCQRHILMSVATTEKQNKEKICFTTVVRETQRALGSWTGCTIEDLSVVVRYLHGVADSSLLLLSQGERGDNDHVEHRPKVDYSVSTPLYACLFLLDGQTLCNCRCTYMDKSAENHSMDNSVANGVDNSVDYGVDNPGYDATVPSWIRLLDSPSFKQSAAQTRPLPTPEENNDEPVEAAKDTEPWYLSPIFDQPVIGYYNRFSQSEPALDYPFRQSATAYHGRLGQSEGAYDGPLGYGPGHQQKSDLNNLQDTYSEIGPHLGHSSLPTGHTLLDQSYISKSPSQHLPYPGVSDHHNLPTMTSAYSLTTSNDRLSSHSRDHPQLLKPEEYLSGLQPTDSYSIKYANAPCGRCTRAVTVVIVVMSLAIVGLTAALTASVLMKKDSVDKQRDTGGHPIVRAYVGLKILNKNFTDSMADTTSADFYSIANPYSKELDRLFLTSSLADVYLGNRIVSLGIKTRAELLFLGTNAVQDGKDVENVIDSAQRATDWRESDAREMGQFVVCGDCVTVSLDFSRVPVLPKPPVLDTEAVAAGATTIATATDSSVTSAATSVPTTSPTNDATASSSGTTTLSTPSLSVTNSTPFLQDGHFVVACDVTNAGNWETLTLGFRPDNSTMSHTAVLVTLTRGSPTPVVSSKYQSRVFAFLDASRGDVSVVTNVTMVTCADRGDYVCRLSLQDGHQYSSVGRVALQELPSAPVITETTSSTQWDATPVYVCSATPGFPPGEMTLSVVKGDNETLERLPGHVTYQGEGCGARAELRVSVLDPLLLGNASRLVCQVFSDHLQLMDATSYSTFHQVALPRSEFTVEIFTDFVSCFVGEQM